MSFSHPISLSIFIFLRLSLFLSLTIYFLSFCIWRVVNVCNFLLSLSLSLSLSLYFSFLIIFLFNIYSIQHISIYLSIYLAMLVRWFRSNSAFPFKFLVCLSLKPLFENCADNYPSDGNEYEVTIKLLCLQFWATTYLTSLSQHTGCVLSLSYSSTLSLSLSHKQNTLSLSLTNKTLSLSLSLSLGNFKRSGHLKGHEKNIVCNLQEEKVWH